MTDIYKEFYKTEIEGFTVRLRFEDEHIHPSDILEDQEDLQAIYEGNVTWLVAIVEVFKCGVELASTSLGAITYRWDDLEDFIEDTFPEMANEAIDEAKSKLNDLLAA